jgi:hypothetical protein
MIEHVPTISCPSRGASYLTAQALHVIDWIKRKRYRLATTHPVAVANFAPAA